MLPICFCMLTIHINKYLNTKCSEEGFLNNCHEYIFTFFMIWCVVWIFTTLIKSEICLQNILSTKIIIYYLEENKNNLPP